MSGPGDRSNDRGADDRIRRWLAASPEHAPDRAIEDTIDRLRDTTQPRMFVIRLPMPLAAAAAALLVIVVGAGLLRLGARWPGPAVVVSPPASDGRCSVEVAVGGRYPIVLGRGFAPDTDVVMDFRLANGTAVRVTVDDVAGLHTDAEGRFGMFFASSSDGLGRNVITAISGGCTATTEVVITADQLPAACPDPTTGPIGLMDGTAYRAAVDLDRPVHQWHFDDAGQLAIDSAGNAGGDIIGEGVTTLAGDRGGGAAFFDGTESYLSIPEVRLADFTLEAWVYLCDVVDNADAIVGNSLDSESVNFFDEHLRLFTTDLDDVVISATRATLGTWQHWALTRDADATRIYLNGVLDATGGAWSREMLISQIGRGDAGYLRGALDELAIYDRALSAAEVLAHVVAR